MWSGGQGFMLLKQPLEEMQGRAVYNRPDVVWPFLHIVKAYCTGLPVPFLNKKKENTKPVR